MLLQHRSPSFTIHYHPQQWLPFCATDKNAFLQNDDSTALPIAFLLLSAFHPISPKLVLVPEIIRSRQLSYTALIGRLTKRTFSNECHRFWL